MVNEMVLPMKEFVNIVFEITEEINGLSQPRNLTRQPMVVRILLDVLMLDLLQVGQPRTSVLAGLQKILISDLSLPFQKRRLIFPFNLTWRLYSGTLHLSGAHIRII